MLDKELEHFVALEQARQQDGLELIASENYASRNVMFAQGSCLTNKYAEGYPNKRYYGGCQWVDEVERLAIERACKLFKCDYANVQPHSGSQANMAVFLALLQPGDCILGLELNAGGHLTHGSPVNISGKLYNAVSYGLTPAGDIDYDDLAALAKEHQPKLIIAGFSAFSGILDWQKFRQIADSVGAYLLADIAHVAGLVAAGVYPSPVGYADVITSTTHKTLRGPRGGIILANNNPTLAKKLNSGIFPGSQGGPLMHVILAKAVAFYEALSPSFTVYQKNVLNNAKVLANRLHEQGFVICGNGTKNHMFLVDLRERNFTGLQAETWLDEINITTNKNTVPNDQRSPMHTSGIRIGTPALTTRGMMETQMVVVADLITARLNNPNAPVADLKAQVHDLCAQFPVDEI